MGLGYTAIMWDEESILKGISEIGVCGYDGIEMSLEKARNVGPKVIAEQLDLYNLDLYLLMGKGLDSDKAANRIAEGAHIVSELGGEFLGFIPPERGEVDDETLERWISHICDSADEAGVKPLLHHHGATHIEQMEEIREWLDRSPENLELLWDTAHHYPYGEHFPEGDVTDGIERFADDIAYIHLKDVDPDPNFGEYAEALTSGDFKTTDVMWFYAAFTDLGNGVIDFQGVADTFDEISYDGHVTIEIESQNRDALVHAKQNLDFWKDITGK